ncbi:MAG: hypothetical protein CBC13_08410 [Planctomycetia bacterium TMED53]|nr:MAG: hypothetical protein CBC13_08410 [Planctomycetia bacterium TMED53]
MKGTESWTGDARGSRCQVYLLTPLTFDNMCILSCTIALCIDGMHRTDRAGWARSCQYPFNWCVPEMGRAPYMGGLFAITRFQALKGLFSRDQETTLAGNFVNMCGEVAEWSIAPAC